MGALVTRHAATGATTKAFAKGWIGDPSALTPTTNDRYLIYISSSFGVKAVNQGAKTFTVFGNASAAIVTGNWIKIRESTGNDGHYSVVSSTYNPGPNDTSIVVNEAIPDPTVDGTVQVAGGIWANQKVGSIAIWTGSSWSYYMPEEGWSFFVKGIGGVIYDGNSWVLLAASRGVSVFDEIYLSRDPVRKLTGIWKPTTSGYLGIMPNANFPQWQFGAQTTAVAFYMDCMNNGFVYINKLSGAGRDGPVVLGRGSLGLEDRAALGDPTTATADGHLYVKLDGSKRQLYYREGASGTVHQLTPKRRVAPIISPAQLVANTNDWNPTGLDTCEMIRVSTDASRNLTGILNQPSGAKIYLVNVGAQDLVIKNEDATSVAINRFSCGADVTLNGGEGVTLIYDGTSSRWRVIGGNV